VIAILGILATIGLSSFRNSQMRGRDVQRKSDLKQVAGALELYYSDYNEYPDAGDIIWGDEFTDGNTIYFKVLPTDPLSYDYLYRVDTTNQKFRLYAYLENSQDKNIVSGLTQTCGTNKNCNFAITSPNTATSGTW